jgi:prepilin-type N-terminal cleavage/methylation domain-containing protein
MKKIIGFTLIELLVVISIISILLALGMSGFTTAQKKSRDSKRKADIKSIQAAMEQYYSVCNYTYPVFANIEIPTIVCPNPSIAILPTVPEDPRNSPYFCPTPFDTNCVADQYKICTVLESEATSEFCVINQQ